CSYCCTLITAHLLLCAHHHHLVASFLLLPILPSHCYILTSCCGITHIAALLFPSSLPLIAIFSYCHALTALSSLLFCCSALITIILLLHSCCCPHCPPIAAFSLLLSHQHALIAVLLPHCCSPMLSSLLSHAFITALPCF